MRIEPTRPPPPDQEEHDADTLFAAVEADLVNKQRRLAFSPEIEARFEADTGRKRNRELIVGGLIVLAIYDLFLINDYLIRPETLSSAVFLRLAVMTPLGLLILWCVYRGQRPAVREALMASAIPIAMCISSIIFLVSTSPNSIYDPFSFSLIILAGTVVFSLRFMHSVVSTVTSLAIMALFLWHDDKLAPEIKGYALMVVGATGVFTLLANYRLETSTRRSYLLLLRETLRASAAMEDNHALTRISYTDPLTKLANRRQFDETFDGLWSMAATTGAQLGLLVIDIDHFKAYNDRYGHPQGDECICRVADTMQRQIRVGLDLAVRLGGEEFVILMPVTTPGAALTAAERVRSAVEELAIPHESAPQSVVTVSVGIAVMRPADGGSTACLMAAADEALYLAKRNGRNRAELAEANER